MAYAISANNSLHFEKAILLSQMVSIAILAVAAAGVGVIHLLFPNFFTYPYFYWGGFGAVARFWPLFAWGAGLNLLVWYFNSDHWPIRADQNRELLKWELLTSTLAGIWEELGYRWAFICYAMIGLMVMNWLFSAGFGWPGAVALCIASAALWYNKEKGLALGALLLAILAALFALYANPVYWFYQMLFYIAHFTTLTLMDPVLYGDHQQLCIYGAFVANLWFRDGHKYQGPLGLVNAWYAGMVLLYATIMYGLFTAIAVHALYDILISVMRFMQQKTR